jgi:uncharacterized protein YndB with AHSA1/START domain
MNSTAVNLEDVTLEIKQEIFVKAPLEKTFAALLDQMGPYNEVDNGRAMPMKLEAWPGGRWFRDLGDDNGHFWGSVQAIKRPTLLEICGPLFMSHAVASNLQYRLTEVDGGTLIKFHQSAFGLLTEDDRHAKQGWEHIHTLVKARAEASGAGKSAAH